MAQQDMMDDRIKKLKEALRLEREITKEWQKRAKQQKDAAKKDKQNKKKLADRNVPGTQMKLGTLAKVAGVVAGAFEFFAQRTKKAADNIAKLTDSFAKLTNASNDLKKVSDKSAKLSSFTNIYDYYKATTSKTSGAGITDAIKASELQNYFDKLGDKAAQEFLEKYNKDIFSTILSDAEANLIGKGAGISRVNLANLGDKLLELAEKTYGDAGGFGVLADERAQALLSNVLSGNFEGTPFSLEGLDAWLERNGMMPSSMMEYADPNKLEQAKLNYLIEQVTVYLEKGEANLADMLTHDAKQSTILKKMAGSLYNFDEVITQDALDTSDAVVQTDKNVSSNFETANKLSEDTIEKTDQAAVKLDDSIGDVEGVVKDGNITSNSILEQLDKGVTVKQMAELVADLAGVPKTLNNINTIIGVLDTTIKDKLVISLDALKVTLDALNTLLEKGIDVNLSDLSLTTTQYDGLIAAIAGGADATSASLGLTQSQLDIILTYLDFISNCLEGMNHVFVATAEIVALIYAAVKPTEEATTKKPSNDYNWDPHNPNGTILFSQEDIDNYNNNKKDLPASSYDKYPIEHAVAPYLYKLYEGLWWLDENVFNFTGHKSSGGGHRFATGGIGTSPAVIEAFEKGPEAIIPLNDSGIQFMSDAIKNANVEGSLGGGDINVNLTLSGLNISDKRDWETVGIKIGQVIQNYKNKTGGI